MDRNMLAVAMTLLVALLSGACSDTVVPDEPDEGLDIVVGPLSSDSTHASICLGFLDGGDLRPIGAFVETTMDGTTEVARASFSGLSEVVTTAEAYAWGRITPSGTGFPAQSYMSTDVGSTTLHVTSGTHQGITISTDSAGGSVKLTAERPVLNADYQFDAAGRFAGSLDGSNITRLVIDNLSGDTSVTINNRSPGGAGTNANGLFTALPDVASGASWPDPSTWPSVLANVPLDASKDLVVYLVAKPGTSGNVDRVVAYPDVSAILYLYVRTSGLASVAVQAE